MAEEYCSGFGWQPPPPRSTPTRLRLGTITLINLQSLMDVSTRSFCWGCRFLSGHTVQRQKTYGPSSFSCTRNGNHRLVSYFPRLYFCHSFERGTFFYSHYYSHDPFVHIPFSKRELAGDLQETWFTGPKTF